MRYTLARWLRSMADRVEPKPEYVYVDNGHGALPWRMTTEEYARHVARVLERV